MLAKEISGCTKMARITMKRKKGRTHVTTKTNGGYLGVSFTKKSKRKGGRVI